MRGKQEGEVWEKVCQGITPADAGKTSAITQLPRIYRDHPRGCGENPPCQYPLKAERGSPPRMRGKLV